MSLTESLIAVSDAYCAAIGLSRARVSTLIFGSGSRLDGVAAGRDLNTRSYEKAMRWFAAHWPAGVAWPAGVERPLGRFDEPGFGTPPHPGPSGHPSPASGRGEEEAA